MKNVLFLVIVFTFFSGVAQTPVTNEKRNAEKENDSLNKKELLNYIGNGYFPTKYFNFDLRYLIKYNQYEGFRTGLGGVTNFNFSDIFRIEGYTVYGFKDEAYKYSFGLGVRLNKKSNTWVNGSYTKDLQETGSSVFLTDKRLFQFFEPRLLNIELFHRTRVKRISLEHTISKTLITEVALSSTQVNPTYNYAFIADNRTYTSYNLSMAVVALQWSPKSNFYKVQNSFERAINSFPKFSFQYTQSIKNAFDGDLNFSKIDFRAQHSLNGENSSKTEFTLTGGIAIGDVPLSHNYHSSPNNVNKETILQRFSIAGNHSFETMYFNEFFSDRFVFFEVKHHLNPFEISPWFKPQLVLITRSTFGNMEDKDKHQGINFDTLEKGYYESGIEINQLLYGFGLSFAYRYGAYHLTNFEDNFAFKFTFNINLGY